MARTRVKFRASTSEEDEAHANQPGVPGKREGWQEKW